jgi:tRNA (guanine-N7-)-methyltransferase
MEESEFSQEYILRVRKIHNADERLDARRHLLIETDYREPKQIDINSVFPDFKEFRLEIGCGKGAFVCGEAIKNPDIAYIAVEKITDVIIFAMEKADELELKNVMFMIADAKNLSVMFQEKTFSEIYINFCDPWPKKRHAKRRLTNSSFLVEFKKLLKDDGHIAFKTDNLDLFEYSIPEFENAGFRLENITRDYHKSEWFGCDTETEYEKNFSEKGVPINRLLAFKNP